MTPKNCEVEPSLALFKGIQQNLDPNGKFFLEVRRRGLETLAIDLHTIGVKHHKVRERTARKKTDQFLELTQSWNGSDFHQC